MNCCEARSGECDCDAVSRMLIVLHIIMIMVTVDYVMWHDYCAPTLMTMISNARGILGEFILECLHQMQCTATRQLCLVVEKTEEANALQSHINQLHNGT